jgi:multisubunit Na+/H+ antiporter MnhF subunit
MILDFVINACLVVMVLLLPLAFYRVAQRKQRPADRLIGVDMVTNLLIGIVIILAIISPQADITIDIGIVIAALSFAGTVGIARYISEGTVF